MGIYTGATVHELAGVVAAGNAMTPAISDIAVVTKLTRVLCLAPFLVLLQWLKARRNPDCNAPIKGNSTGGDCKIVVPWFAVGFVGIAAVNSFVAFPAAVKTLAVKCSGHALAMAMAGLGIETSWKKIKTVGPKPFVLALVLFGHLLVSGYFAATFLHRLAF